MNKSLLEEKVPQILRKLDFHQKNRGRFSDGFSDGLRCVAWESDRKLGPFGFFVLEKKGKIAIKKEVLETLLPAIGSNMIHLQYFIRLLHRFYFYHHLSHITTYLI